MKPVSRRLFLETAGASCLLFGGCIRNRQNLQNATSGISSDTPPRKLRMAVIGTGSQGRFNCRELMRHQDIVEIAALCDPDRTALTRTAAILRPYQPEILGFTDYRTLFRRKDLNLDGVIIAAPDHHHAFATTLALKAGIDVYIEPPLTRTIAECRALKQLAIKQDALIQLGNQSSASAHLQRGVAGVRQGILGDITEVWAWTDSPTWPQSILRPEGEDPTPDFLDWDLWLGGAPVRPFKRGTYHTGVWRGWYDFGTGALGALGCNLLNLPFRALGIHTVHQTDVAGLPFATPETYPSTSRTRFVCSHESGNSKVVINWLEAGQLPPPAILAGLKETLGTIPASGCILVGTRGRLVAAHESAEYLYAAMGADTKFTVIDKHPLFRKITASSFKTPPTQLGEFLEAVRHKRTGTSTAKTPLSSDIDHAASLTDLILRGCLTQRLRISLDWEARKNTSAYSSLATALQDERPRKGWRS